LSACSFSCDPSRRVTILDSYILRRADETCQDGYMKFQRVSGRPCLDFAGTLKYRASAREDLLTNPQQLSDWAVQAGLVDAVTELTDDELAAAIALREAIYRIVFARLEGRRPKVADVNLLNEHASQPQLTPRL